MPRPVNGPEGQRKLAGGASHRFRSKIECAPEGALEVSPFPPPPPGRIRFSDLIRWLAPPANFHRPSGPFHEKAGLQEAATS
jgi:hypothetical protein